MAVGLIETWPECRIHPAVTYAAVICKSKIITHVTVREVGRFLKFAHFNCSNLLVHFAMYYAWHMYGDYGGSPVVDG